MHEARSASEAARRAAAVVFAILVTAALFGGFTQAAHAAYAGKNGMIAYTHRLPGNEGSWSIETVNPDGSGRNRLGGMAGPVWSPDGNKFLFLRFPCYGCSELYVANADGTAERKLSDGIAAVWSPTWSPDGTKIAYKNASTGNAASGELWVMNADGSGRTQITRDGTGKGGLDWGMTPSGSRIVFKGFLLADGGWGIYTMAPDGSARTRVTAVPSQMAFFSADALDWSPDGTKVAISTHQGAAITEHGVSVFPSDIWVVDLAANTVTNVTKTTTWAGPHETDPSWSPDGSKIAFAAWSYNWDGTAAKYVAATIYTMNATGGGIAKVSDPQTTATPSYSTATYDGNPDWQPCITGVTKTCKSVTPPPPAPSTPACSDGYDNDGDGKIDYPADPGCSSTGDDDETDTGSGDGSGGGGGAGGGGAGGGSGDTHSGSARLLFDFLSASPNQPRAGRLFTVRLGVTTEDGSPVASAVVTCRATILGKALRPVARGLRNGIAFCTWRVPQKAHKRTLAGSIAVTKAGGAVRKAFAKRIR